MYYSTGGSWVESGYIRLARDVEYKWGMCDIAMKASYLVVNDLFAVSHDHVFYSSKLHSQIEGGGDVFSNVTKSLFRRYFLHKKGEDESLILNSRKVVNGPHKFSTRAARKTHAKRTD
ncbi:cysteine proteinase [Striga asiatica]|uniref:Cysteine proteinase n=1 Tax=Striga asiatica TaxID=4170 RepID=A0A5A7Q5K5_STRAF|nr:cysteine proteinase [Striga asiatica]